MAQVVSVQTTEDFMVITLSVGEMANVAETFILAKAAVDDWIILGVVSIAVCGFWHGRSRDGRTLNDFVNGKAVQPVVKATEEVGKVA